MKTKEELDVLKKEIETLNQRFAELTEEELAQVSGGGLRGGKHALVVPADSSRVIIK